MRWISLISSGHPIQMQGVIQRIHFLLKCMEHSIGQIVSWVTNQTSVNLIKLKSYQASSPTTTLLLLLLSRFSRGRLCATPQTAATRLPRPWDSPGKNTGVGCHFLLQRMKVKSQSEVAQLCPTLSDPMHCSLSGSPVPGILQARVLEGGAIATATL